MDKERSGILHKIRKTRYLYRNGGLGGVVFAMFYSFFNRFCHLHILRAVKVDIEEVNPAHLDQLGSHRFGLYRPQALRRWAEDKESDLDHDFLDYAEAKGDRCFAIFDEETLVNYCWCSDEPTIIDGDLHMAFHPDYLYRYREYTRESHRGRRLSAYNSAESLRRLAGSGKRGFAGYVDAANFISYRSLLRKNHTFVGYVVILGKGPRAWIWHSPGARRWGFQVMRQPRTLEQTSWPG